MNDVLKETGELIAVLLLLFPVAETTATLRALSVAICSTMPAGTLQPANTLPCEMFTTAMLYLA